MAKNEKTSARVAKIASKGLRIGKLSPKEIRTLSGSNLTQAPDKTRAGKKGRKARGYRAKPER